MVEDNAYLTYSELIGECYDFVFAPFLLHIYSWDTLMLKYPPHNLSIRLVRERRKDQKRKILNFSSKLDATMP